MASACLDCNSLKSVFRVFRESLIWSFSLRVQAKGLKPDGHRYHSEKERTGSCTDSTLHFVLRRGYCG